MQPLLPFDIRPAPAEPAAHAEPNDSSRIEFVRVRRARRYILRVRPDGTLRVTVPRGGSRAEGERFAVRHRRWIERERARIRNEHTPVTWGDGTAILFRGVEHAIAIAETRTGCVAAYADRVIALSGASGVREAVEADLKVVARAELLPRLRQLAAAQDIAVERVLIRHQRSRWGSCSPDGTIALNFRLVQMPDAVRDYVLIHELMHRRQQNHSRRFWRLVEAACPDFRQAEHWLKTRGRSLF